MSDLPSFVCVPFLTAANRYVEGLSIPNIESVAINSQGIRDPCKFFGCCYWVHFGSRSRNDAKGDFHELSFIQLKELRNTQGPKLDPHVPLRVDLTLNCFPHKLSNASTVTSLLSKLIPYLSHCNSCSTSVLAVAYR